MAHYRVGDDVYRTGANKGYWFSTIGKFTISNVTEFSGEIVYTIKGTSSLDETATFNYEVTEEELSNPSLFRVTTFTIKPNYQNYWD